MGAAGLIDIKRRLKSVQSTKKITNAMGLVATSKLRKCRKELASSSMFVEEIDKVMNSLVPIAKREHNIPCIKGNNSEKKLYIVITSDSGLCGGYNNNVVSYLEDATLDFKDKVSVITVGSKGISYVKRAGFDMNSEYVDISDIPNVKEVKVMSEKILKLFNDGKFSEVSVVYTKFFSPVKQNVTIEKLLPLEESSKEKVSEASTDGNLERVVEDTLDVFLKGKLVSLILSSKCSEQSSRMTAMDGATNNANDIIKDLNLRYNRIRQAMITQEISEIVGGAEAQK